MSDIKMVDRSVGHGELAGHKAQHDLGIAKRIDATQAYPVMATLFEHLGMGFIVAAIAVPFYEWGAHIKDVMELNKRTVQLSEELSALKSAVGENALDGALRVLIRGERPDYDEDLIQPDLSNVSISGLTPESDHIGLWTAVWEALPVTTENVIKEAMDRWRAALRKG